MTGLLVFETPQWQSLLSGSPRQCENAITLQITWHDAKYGDLGIMMLPGISTLRSLTSSCVVTTRQVGWGMCVPVCICVHICAHMYRHIPQSTHRLSLCMYALCSHALSVAGVLTVATQWQFDRQEGQLCCHCHVRNGDLKGTLLSLCVADNGP